MTIGELITRLSQCTDELTAAKSNVMPTAASWWIDHRDKAFTAHPDPVGIWRETVQEIMNGKEAKNG